MMSERSIEIGGAPVITVERPAPADAPAFTRAQILPGRGMMILQITARLPGRGEIDLLFAPPLEQARELLHSGQDDMAGNLSFSIGGAFLIPYANRIRGKLSADSKTVEAVIGKRTVRLPANGGGKRSGAERYAIHGLILASRVDDVRRTTTDEEDSVRATLQAGDFGGHWLSTAKIEFEHVLRSDGFTLNALVKNCGDEELPVGIGWHPYFALPSGRREQARIQVPARSRLLVNDYDEVLPTGEIAPITGTPYDFSASGGRTLENMFMDDCFVDLEKTSVGDTVVEIIDPAASYGLRIVATSPQVSAIQVYAPAAEPYVVVEPQFNWANPYGQEWPLDIDRGMVVLDPGESVVYSVRLELFTP